MQAEASPQTAAQDPAVRPRQTAASAYRTVNTTFAAVRAAAEAALKPRQPGRRTKASQLRDQPSPSAPRDRPPTAGSLTFTVTAARHHARRRAAPTRWAVDDGTRRRPASPHRRPRRRRTAAPPATITARPGTDPGRRGRRRSTPAAASGSPPRSSGSGRASSALQLDAPRTPGAAASLRRSTGDGDVHRHDHRHGRRR